MNTHKRKEKQTMSDFLREWGLDEGTVKRGRKGLRYCSLPIKGIAWWWCSKFVREADKELGCISCGKRVKLQAGHFIPADRCGNELLMSRDNVNGECEFCNAWSSSHLLHYERGLDRRYGAGTAQKLKDRFFNQKLTVYRREDWAQIAREYRELYKAEL